MGTGAAVTHRLLPYHRALAVNVGDLQQSELGSTQSAKHGTTLYDVRVEANLFDESGRVAPL
jgi:hypothetical protein